MTPSRKTSGNTPSIILFAGLLAVFVGVIALLFDLHPPRQPGFGWTIFLAGLAIAVLGFALKQSPSTSTSSSFRPEIKSLIKTEAEQTGFAPATSNINPSAVSFVAPSVAATIETRTDPLSKSITPEILNIRFAIYRCEISSDQFKAIYQNATQKELKWYEISAIVVRQFPYQAPWEGKLLLDIVPVVVAGEKMHPCRVLSNTYVNYGVLPQGQSTSTKENMRRLAAFILSQSRSIFVDPGTDYFVHAGQPPVRFLSMAQFVEYDSQYE